MFRLTFCTARQNNIPGTVPSEIEHLQKLAEDYEEIKNERCALSVREKEAKTAVETYMIGKDIREYRVNSKTRFVIEEGEKHLKIVKAKSKDEDGDESESEE